MYGRLEAKLAVDGSYDTASCTYSDVHPWWAVYLDAAYDVAHVTVTNEDSEHLGMYRSTCFQTVNCQLHLLTR